MFAKFATDLSQLTKAKPIKASDIRPIVTTYSLAQSKAHFNAFANDLPGLQIAIPY